jgi:hypothetical protein
MQRTRFISILAAGLLLSNIALVVFIMRGRDNHDLMPPPHGAHGGPRNIIIERLHLSPEQVTDYDKLIKQHRAAVRQTDMKIMELKNALYLCLNEQGGGMKDSLINAITQTQHEMEEVHYHHFEGIRDLCTGEQKKDFELLSHDLGALFAPKHHKPR